MNTPKSTVEAALCLLVYEVLQTYDSKGMQCDRYDAFLVTAQRIDAIRRDRLFKERVQEVLDELRYGDRFRARKFFRRRSLFCEFLEE